MRPQPWWDRENRPVESSPPSAPRRRAARIGRLPDQLGRYGGPSRAPSRLPGIVAPARSAWQPRVGHERGAVWIEPRVVGEVRYTEMLLGPVRGAELWSETSKDHGDNAVQDSQFSD